MRSASASPNSRTSIPASSISGPRPRPVAARDRDGGGRRGRSAPCRAALRRDRAGGAAHLPGMVASKTTLPVLGVPIPSKHLQGQDSLLSIVQIPRGIPVATFAIGEAGAANAGLFAVSILAHENKILAKKLEVFREKQAKKVIDMNLSEKP